MTTKSEPIARWEVVDGQPVAHVEVMPADMTLEQMRKLCFDLRAVYDEMYWHTVKWLAAGVKRSSKVHLLLKSAYEEDSHTVALCGKLPPKWDVTFMLGGEPEKGETCKACYDAWLSDDLN